jgi:sugar phosphate isomerase/epimerase
VAIASDVKAGDLETLRRLADGVAALGPVPIKVSPPVWYSRQAPYEQLFREAVEAYRRSLELLRPYNIRALVETHNNTIVVSASLAHRLVSTFDPGSIGVIYDVNNLACDGYETFRIGMELLGDYFQHCHLAGHRPVLQGRGPDGSARWEYQGCDLADGILSIPQLLADLKAARYGGFISVEDFRAGDPKTILRAQINYLKSLEEEL